MTTVPKSMIPTNACGGAFASNVPASMIMFATADIHNVRQHKIDLIKVLSIIKANAAYGHAIAPQKKKMIVNDLTVG